MTTLQGMTLDVATYLSRPYRGTATGGSTTTLVDTALAVAGNDYFAGGCIWFLTGNNLGKSAAITSWTGATQTFGFATQSGACAAADRYAAGNRDYPRWKLQDAVNQALKSCGEVLKLDTSLATVADQMSYTLPAGVNDVRRVEVAMYTTSPYGYVPHYNWRTINGAIVFEEGSQPDTAGYGIRLWYMGDHAELTGDTDVVDASLHPERVKWHAVLHALRWKMGIKGADDPLLAQMYGEAQQRAVEADNKYPILAMQRDPIHAYWSEL